MLDHVSIGGARSARRRGASTTRRWRRSAMRACSAGRNSLGYGREAPAFWVSASDSPVPADPRSGLHFCFAAPTRGSVDAFHAAALAARRARQRPARPAPRLRPELLRRLRRRSGRLPARSLLRGGGVGGGDQAEAGSRRAACASRTSSARTCPGALTGADQATRSVRSPRARSQPSTSTATMRQSPRCRRAAAAMRCHRVGVVGVAVGDDPRLRRRDRRRPRRHRARGRRAQPRRAGEPADEQRRPAAGCARARNRRSPAYSAA